jgi:hypothetical protein
MNELIHFGYDFLFTVDLISQLHDDFVISFGALDDIGDISFHRLFTFRSNVVSIENIFLLSKHFFQVYYLLICMSSCLVVQYLTACIWIETLRL